MPSRSSQEDPSVNAVVDELRSAFSHHFDPSDWSADDPITVAYAPGRVNLIGDHTDYNDGFVLPATIDRAVYVALRRRPDAAVHLRSLNFEEAVDYALPDPPFDALPGWARYVAGVAQELRTRTGMAAGFEGVIHGNVPLGAGLSSSAALEVAVAMGLDALFGLDLGAAATARLCQTVEHDYVGVQCGIMDQMAARLGRSGHALALDCRTLDVEHVPLPLDEAALVIADSRVRRELADSKYNERRAECERAVAFFQQFDTQVQALRDVPLSFLDGHGMRLPTPIYRRARHVVSENARVRDGVTRLRQHQLDAFGALMNASHRSLRDDYAVSTPELDALVDAAQATPGVFGARMTGAGFGGCVVCLVRNGAVAALRERLADRYVEDFGCAPGLYTVQRNLEATVL
jgi:galactokinase